MSLTMDPDANLQDQEELIQEISEYTDNPRHPACLNAQADLHARRRELSEWLSRGGFAPDWAKAPKASVYFGKAVTCG